MNAKNLFAIVVALASGICVSAPYPQYQHLVEKHAAAQGLDKNLVWAVMARESGGNRYALSNKNARGLLQVIPPTAARMGVNPKYLYKPEHNIIAGTRYLRFLQDRYKGNIDLMLAGYNAGEGAVDKYRGIPPYRETQKYVRLVKARYARLNGGVVRVSAPAMKPAVAKAVRQEQIALHQPERQPWDAFGDF
ncbi:lytic transglycosylase domain-containing protein [Neisseria iguanae]|uniref:lytic transglycosylase domain-containing protein n=1 Tax=Neisseria iguanae TaxID=90242 RepID=UPI001FE8D220|nr:lytic transglycosylase domain-containing protein [Neisseria iguanae]